MSDPDILANIARGWRSEPDRAAAGTARSGLTAAIWSDRRDEVREVRADPCDTIQVAVQLAPVRTRMSFDTRAACDVNGPAGTLNMVLPGERPACVITGPYSVLHLYLSGASWRESIELEGFEVRRLELIDPVGAPNPAITRIGQAVRAELTGGQGPRRLHLDILGLELMAQLLRRHSTLDPACLDGSRIAAGGLAPWQVKRVLDYIEADLTRDLAVVELANLCSLSPFHFTRAFHRSVGRPPYAFVTERRMERARRMLDETTLSVTQIALEVGYSEPSHLARVFKRVFGVGPSLYRRQRL